MQVLIWGNNLYGKLGLGYGSCCFTERDPTKLNVSGGTTWIQISCGPHHTAAVSSSGELFTWGLGSSGQLGHGDEKVQDAPKKVEIPGGEAVVKVACGRSHTAAVTATGKLLTWYVSSCYLLV